MTRSSTRRPPALVPQAVGHGPTGRWLRQFAAVALLLAAAVVAGCGDDWARAQEDAGQRAGCGGTTDGVGGFAGTWDPFGGGGEIGGAGQMGGEMGGGAAGMGGAASGGSGGPGNPTGNFFTVIALPDTQYYSSTYPEVFEAQMRWIIDQRANRRIAFVLHEGDIVDSDVAPQWDVASRSLHKLDGVVPYVLSQGNHDYFVLGGIDDRSTLINQYFHIADLAKNAGFLGSFEAERVENTAQFLMMGDTAWLVISVEFGPRDAAVAWADSVLKAHPDVPAMVVTHAYLYWDGTRYDHVASPGQSFSPYMYSRGPAPGSVNDGEEMWKKMIEQNENVRFVISGHVFNSTGEAAARLTSAHPSGRTVHQIVANYQETAHGGGGYLRLMEFCPDSAQLRVSTYSPFLDRWKRDAANEFILPLP